MATQSKSKSSTPPPAYSEPSLFAMPGPGSPSYANQPFFAPLSSPPTHTHPLFGPTPIAQQQELLLPYYDSRSPYSVAQATSRARWRFVGSVAYALVIWMAVMVLLGVQFPVGGIN